MKKYFVICLGLMLAMGLLAQVQAYDIRKVTVICEYSGQALEGAHVWVEEKVKTTDGGLVGPDGTMTNEFWEPPVGLGVNANDYTDYNGKVVLKLFKGGTYKINVLKTIKGEKNEPILIGTGKIIDKLNKDEIFKFVWNRPINKIKNPSVGQPQPIKTPLIPR